MSTIASGGLTDEQREIVKKIEKLLRLAGKTTSQEEAASASAKAAELLAAYNLSSADVGTGEDDGRRAEERLKGGAYEYERDLISVVASVNFCIAWVQPQWVKRPANEQNTKWAREQDYWTRENKRVWHIRIIGRPVNIASTLAMYDYIREVSDRLCREYLLEGSGNGGIYSERNIAGLAGQLRSRRATSFRRGITERCGARLYRARQDQIREEERAAMELREAAAKAMAERGEQPTSRALTLSSYSQSERDANIDHMMGDVGYSARQRAERDAEQKRQARAAAEAEAELTRLAAENPKEAQRLERERLREERRRSRRSGPGSRGGTSHHKPYDSEAYFAGYAAGAHVGLDPQAGGRESRSVGNTKALPAV